MKTFVNIVLLSSCFFTCKQFVERFFLMRAHSSVHRHRHIPEPQSMSGHYDPSRRWSLRSTTSLHSPHSERRVRAAALLSHFDASADDALAAGDGGEQPTSRLRSLGAAYGSATPYVAAPKSVAPPPLLTGQTRSPGYDGNSSRYPPYERRRSSIGSISPLIAPPPPPPLTPAGPGRSSSLSDDVTLYSLSERATTTRAGVSSPHPVRLSGAAGAGAPLRSKSRSHASAPASTSTTTPPPCTYLIPPPQAEDAGKLVVVLDLDETLVYSRDVTLYERPGVALLLKTLKGRCELIVWTAGTREYALDVIKVIDTVCAVQHCIYRHPMWWTGDAGCAKDLRLLGRPMDRVILVDNTPSVFSANPRNSLLVSDFMVPFPRAYNAHEKALATLADIFDHVFRRFPQPCVSDVLASKRITRQLVYLERGSPLELNVLAVRSAAEVGWASTTRASRLRYSP